MNHTCTIGEKTTKIEDPTSSIILAKQQVLKNHLLQI